MTIHHATLKRAAALGVILTEEDGTVTALHAERNRRIENEDPKAALAFCLVAAKLALEYPLIHITDDGEADIDDEVFYEIDADKSLDDTIAELLEAAPAMEEEEEPSGKVVVAERYKQEYAARGDASGCGDWLHVTLKRYSTEAIDAGKKTTIFDDRSFTEMLRANGVAIKGKFAEMPTSGKKGWEGRYRMNGRQMLEAPLLRAKGVLQLEGGAKPTVMPDEDYVALLSLKRHNALREELETLEAEAEAVVVKKPRAKKAK